MKTAALFFALRASLWIASILVFEWEEGEVSTLHSSFSHGTGSRPPIDCWHGRTTNFFCSPRRINVPPVYPPEFFIHLWSLKLHTYEKLSNYKRDTFFFNVLLCLIPEMAVIIPVLHEFLHDGTKSPPFISFLFS